ncbi:MAG: right-handed parallel beta-helix repeat-containing protein, partial [Candidatus Omnitrophica bacterium]|nr:right-handed parallel beta-helix repeat-containing protein [Candidatus Omnitrophota bacterium]
VDQQTGDDTNDGQTVKTAFESVRRGLGRLQAGDMLLIKSGVYYEQFWVRAQGEPDARIIIGPFGDGEVIIDSGLQVDQWKSHTKNIFSAKTAKPVRNIVLDEIPIHPVRTLEEVADGLWYFDKERSEVFLYLTDGDPAAHEIGLIVDNKYSHAVFLNGATYVTLYGLTIRYAGGKGVEILGPHNRIERCNIKFNGGHGIGMFSYKQLNSAYTRTEHNHIYHNVLANWPRGRWPYKTGAWGMGIGGPAGPGCEHTGNVVHKNGGEGIGSQSNGVVRDNIVGNNWSVNIYADGAENTVIDNNLIYCEEPDPRDIYNNFDHTPEDGKAFRRLRAEGIMTADELKRTNAQNVRLTNNIIIGCRRGITHYGRSRQSGLKNMLVANNTIVVPHAKGLGEHFVGIRVPWNNGNNRDTVYRNNIIYGTHPETYLASISNDPLGRAEPFDGVTFDHNLWYHTTNSKPFNIGLPKLYLQNYDFNGWKKRDRQHRIGTGSLFADPEFVQRTGYTPESVALSEDSPAVDAGDMIAGLLSDYFGNQRQSAPDIGALEVTGSP